MNRATERGAGGRYGWPPIAVTTRLVSRRWPRTPYWTRRTGHLEGVLGGLGARVEWSAAAARRVNARGKISA